MFNVNNLLVIYNCDIEISLILSKFIEKLFSFFDGFKILIQVFEKAVESETDILDCNMPCCGKYTICCLLKRY